MNNIKLKSSFLPDFCSVRILFIVIIISELLSIVIVLVLSRNITDFISFLAEISFLVLWIALLSAALLCMARHYLNALPDFWTSTLSYLLILLVTLCVSESAWWLRGQWPDFQDRIITSHLIFLAKCIGISAISSAMILRYFYVQHQWRLRIQSEANARFQALTSRIRPHFLFNCMNTIASLTRIDPTLAEQAIEDLADLFRASLQESKVMVTINDEVDICRRYLRMEEHRLGDRMSVQWQLDSLPGDAFIPSLSIQPLLENAIYHGIENLPEGGTIRIDGKIDSNRITIRVTNPVSVQKVPRSSESNQIAQDILRQRLQACYDGKSELDFNHEDNLYTATINFPYLNEDINR